MRGRDDYKYNLVLNVVTTNLNVLRTRMKSGVANDKDSNIIVTMHEHWRRR